MFCPNVSNENPLVDSLCGAQPQKQDRIYEEVKKYSFTKKSTFDNMRCEQRECLLARVHVCLQLFDSRIVSRRFLCKWCVGISERTFVELRSADGTRKVRTKVAVCIFDGGSDFVSLIVDTINPLTA